MNRTEEAYSPQRRVQIARTGPGSADSGSIRTSLSSGSHSSVSASLSAQIDLRVQSETWYSTVVNLGVKPFAWREPMSTVRRGHTSGSEH